MTTKQTLKAKIQALLAALDLTSAVVTVTINDSSVSADFGDNHFALDTAKVDIEDRKPGTHVLTVEGDVITEAFHPAEDTTTAKAVAAESAAKKATANTTTSVGSGKRSGSEAKSNPAYGF